MAVTYRRKEPDLRNTGVADLNRRSHTSRGGFSRVNRNHPGATFKDWYLHMRKATHFYLYGLSAIACGRIYFDEVVKIEHRMHEIMTLTNRSHEVVERGLVRIYSISESNHDGVYDEYRRRLLSNSWGLQSRLQQLRRLENIPITEAEF
ncbi:hypothetical protein [Roseibium sp. Sym1]|uniref:hypothetical protein n=1 Tax=Roseibium sp. Sym1 TaxID=3016006 RepID=UPI0022B5CE49|nr:hypothetical protein [Roseibium sp. Sym1]